MRWFRRRLVWSFVTGRVAALDHRDCAGWSGGWGQADPAGRSHDRNGGDNRPARDRGPPSRAAWGPGPIRTEVAGESTHIEAVGGDRTDRRGDARSCRWRRSGRRRCDGARQPEHSDQQHPQLAGGSAAAPTRMSTKERAIRHHDHVTSIHLRPIGESDLSVLERLAVDPLISGPFDWHGFGDPGALRRRLAEDGFLGRDPHNLAVALDQDDGCIGDVSWLAIPTGPTSACWNIGVTILPEFRGKGYGTAAQRLLAEYLFATTTVNRVEAGTDVDNVAEQRALEKARFIREGVRRGSQFRNGQWRDMAMYGRLRDDHAPATAH